MGTVDCYSILLVFLVNCGFTLTNSVIFNFLVATARTIHYPVLNTSVLSCIKHQGGVSCAAGHVPSGVLPVHVCVLPSVSVITVTCSAGGAGPEPGEGQRAREDRICFSAALGVSRNCEK